MSSASVFAGDASVALCPWSHLGGFLLIWPGSMCLIPFSALKAKLKKKKTRIVCLLAIFKHKFKGHQCLRLISIGPQGNLP